jgi:hemoglobin
VRGVGDASDRMPEQVTLYEAVGGMAFFEALVDRFYVGVEADPALLRVYPDPEDLAPARRRLTLFLAQYWGGPPRYGEERGHPRLRMRHAPFEIGPGERDRWLHHMTEAVRFLGPREDIERALLDYFATAAEGMRNHA